MGEPRTRAYRKGVLEAEDFPLADVSDWLEEPDTIVWIDFLQPSEAQLHDLAEEVGLHELAVEDALAPHQRPKLDRYQSHLFLSCKAVRLDVPRGTLDTTELDAFIGKRWLVTVRENDGIRADELRARWDRSPDFAVHGVGFLLYGLLDVVADGYFAAIGAFDDYFETVSDGILSERPLPPSEQRHWFDMRRALARFHRLVTPLREAVNALMRRDTNAASEELYPYYQDVYDHILRATESSESLRDLVATIVETNLSLRDYRQNLVVKKVGSWAAIIAVPALVTGYYGMNVPYPGSGTVGGVIVSAVIMVVLAVGLYLIFRRQDWL
jgi:magnesium transporter